MQVKKRESKRVIQPPLGILAKADAKKMSSIVPKKRMKRTEKTILRFQTKLMMRGINQVVTKARVMQASPEEYKRISSMIKDDNCSLMEG